MTSHQLPSNLQFVDQNEMNLMNSSTSQHKSSFSLVKEDQNFHMYSSNPSTPKHLLNATTNWRIKQNNVAPQILKSDKQQQQNKLTSPQKKRNMAAQQNKKLSTLTREDLIKQSYMTWQMERDLKVLIFFFEMRYKRRRRDLIFFHFFQGWGQMAGYLALEKRRHKEGKVRNLEIISFHIFSFL